MPVGNAAPPRPRRPESVTALHDLRRLHLQRLLEAAIAAMRHVVVNAGRLDDADAREGEPLLIPEVGNLLGQSVMQRVLRRHEETAPRTGPAHRHARPDHRPPGRRSFDFDQRLEPRQAA